MLIDFDPAKDEANRDKHGVSLAFGARILEDPGLAILPTVRLGDEEERRWAWSTANCGPRFTSGAATSLG